MQSMQARPDQAGDGLLQPLQKTLVVGLGGTGKRVLLQLKRRLLKAGYRDSAAQPHLQLICLDFDPADECAPNGGGKKEACLAADEVCWLDGAAIHNRLSNLRQEHNLDFYRDWYPDQEGAVIRMGAYRAGAAQWRPLGRIGFYEYAERIQVVLRRSLNRLLEVDLQRDSQDQSHGVTVYIVCSLAGGTGGGTFLDVAYFLRTMPVDIKQFGLLLLPGIYAEYDISGRLFANTYACLKELSVFVNQGQAFEARYPNGRRISVPRHGQSPFDQVYLYDNIIQPDEVTSNVDVMSSIMAETVFFDISEVGLSQMQQSAATNLVQLAGAHDDTSLARQSVFSMVGSLTLLLPALADLEGMGAQQYLGKVLLKDMEKAQQEQGQARVHDPALMDQVRRSFHGLDMEIDDLLAKTKRSCLVWPEGFLDKAARDLGDELKGYSANPGQAEHHLNHWLEEFLDPRADGGFSATPHKLPDVALDGQGELDNALHALAEKLKTRIEQVLNEAGHKDAPRPEDLYYYLKFKAEALRAAVADQHRQLDRTIDDRDGAFQVLKKQLLDLYASNLPQEGGLDELSARHWARRFLVAVQQYYATYACELRANLLLAAVMDDRRRDDLVDERTLQTALDALPQIKAVAEEGQQAGPSLSRQDNSATVRSLVDQTFMESFWEWAQDILPISGGFMDFMVHAQQHFTEREKQSGPSPQRLAELAREFCIDKFRQAWQQHQVRGLELHDFVNRRLRAKELARARHDHMVRDALLNTSKNHRAYAALPSYNDRSSRERQGDLFQDFKGMVDNALEASTLDVKSYPIDLLGSHQPGKILVRHVSLNHPATNLRGIGEYYYAYARYGANRKLFHIDQKFLDLPEVIDDHLRLRYVTCGNPGCHEDITELPRRTIVCPHCQRPIRSRCGNDGCADNELHRPREDWNPQNPDKYCPTCHKPARTYWWRCDDHNVDLRTDSNYCAHCLAENREGTREFAKVSRRQDVKRHLDCPGCQHDCKDKPFRIEFLEVYDEVPDEVNAQAWEVYNDQTRHGNCPKCGAQLLPFCPYEVDPEHRHFVHRFVTQSDCQSRKLPTGGLLERRQGLFICTSDQEHAQQVIKECSHCHLPLRDDAKYCPRCKREALDPNQIVKHLNEAFGSNDHERALAEDVALLIKCKIEKEGWLWFGLSEQEWKSMKGDEPKAPFKTEAANRRCRDKVDRNLQGQEVVPPEAAALFNQGLREETNEPS